MKNLSLLKKKLRKFSKKNHNEKEFDEPVYQSDIKEIDEMLKVANDVIDNDEKKK